MKCVPLADNRYLENFVLRCQPYEAPFGVCLIVCYVTKIVMSNSHVTGVK